MKDIRHWLSFSSIDYDAVDVSARMVLTMSCEFSMQHNGKIPSFLNVTLKL